MVNSYWLTASSWTDAKVLAKKCKNKNRGKILLSDASKKTSDTVLILHKSHLARGSYGTSKITVISTHR